MVPATAATPSSATPTAMAQRDVAEAIRRDILEGNLVAGQRLVETDLSESLGASRGAVRGALIDLTHEGLVERIANRGARVRVVSVEEAVEIIEVRAAVEALCAAKAAEKITDEEIAELRQLGEEMSAAVASGDVGTYSRLNTRLDERFIAISGQEVAAETIARLQGRSVRHQYRLAFRPGRPQVSLPQHRAIIEALAQRDPAAADRAVREHLASVLVAVREAASSR